MPYRPPLACHALGPCYAEPSPSAAATVPAAAAAAPNTRGQPAGPPSAPDAAGNQTDETEMTRAMHHQRTPTTHPSFESAPGLKESPDYKLA